MALAYIMKNQKKPNPVDIKIGSQLKKRRDRLRMSQETLGAHLGISFQQIQKYEKGTNRLAASRLFEISKILKSPLAYFFEDLPEGGVSQGGFAEGDAAGYEPGFLSTPEGKNLTRAFAQIDDPVVRERVLQLVEALAKQRK